MTGPEIAAAGVALTKGAALTGKALVGGEKEQALILEATKGTRGYQVAAVARGDRMAAKQLVINRVLSPLFWFAGYRRDYFEGGDFAADMAETLTGVSAEELTTPSPNVAAQAMEGLSYSLDEPDLKAMYLNLLATASQTERRDQAHPSFAEVIRQLTQAEAALLPLFLEHTNGVPMVEIRATKTETLEFRVLQRHVTALYRGSPGVPTEVPDWAIYVDNWVRLGLVQADYTTHRTGTEAYEFVEARPEYIRAKSRTDLGDYLVTYEKGLLTGTNFGLRFAAAVISPASSAAATPDDRSVSEESQSEEP